MKTYAVMLFSLILILPAERTPLTSGGTNREAAGEHSHALFAAGCFWGVEAAFRNVNGVVATEAGYTGGHFANPSYRDVSSQTTGHAEAVRVTYDPAKISYAELLDIFWGCHDPSADPGESHRSAIFCFTHEQEKTARDSLAECERRGLFAHPIQTQIVPAMRFYPAEYYHQHYSEKLGRPGRCEIGRHLIRTHLAEEAARTRHPGS